MPDVMRVKGATQRLLPNETDAGNNKIYNYL